MGVPRLKKKVELRYRKGSMCETRNCRHCESFIKQGMVKDTLIPEGRCKIIGDKPGRMFRIRGDYTCNAQKTTCKPPGLKKGGA